MKVTEIPEQQSKCQKRCNQYENFKNIRNNRINMDIEKKEPRTIMRRSRLFLFGITLCWRKKSWRNCKTDTKEYKPLTRSICV